MRLDNALLIPTFLDTVRAFRDAIVTGGLLGKAWYSIRILLIGYAAGLALAAIADHAGDHLAPRHRPAWKR